MSNILISGYYGFNNAGDEALLTAILASLRAAEPEADIIVISGDPADTAKKHQVKSLHRFSVREILAAMDRADLVISGGGSLLQDVTSKRSLLYYLSVIALAKRKGKKVMLFAQGIGPIRSPFMRSLTRIVCRRADVITVRDQDSADELARLGIGRKKVEVTADSVLTLEKSPLEPGAKILAEAGVQTGRPIIGVTVRSWPENQRCLQQLGSALTHLGLSHKAQIVILPLQYPMDMEASTALQGYISSGPEPVILLQRTYSTEEFLSLIGNFDLLIGMRLHALIFAAVMGIPFLAVSYDPKVDSFVKAIGTQPVGTVENLSAAAVEKQAEALWGRAPFLQNARIAQMRRLALNNVDRASALLHKQ